MDFTNRGIHQPQSTNGSSGDLNSQSSHNQQPAPKKKGLAKFKDHKLLNITYIGLLFSITILIVGVVCSIFLFDNNRGKESKLVDTSKYQAVFLNSGQVYFGKIADLNNRYVALSGIYYLQVNQPVQPGDKNQQNNFTLAKLGCELHRPQDLMVINRDQITFWENLKDETDPNTISGGIKKEIESTGGKRNCTPSSSSSSNSGSSSNTNSTNSTTNSTSNNTSSGSSN